MMGQKDKIQLIITAVLTAVLIGLVIRVSKKPRSSPPSKPAFHQRSLIEDSSPQLEASDIYGQLFHVSKDWTVERDPFFAVPRHAAAPKGFVMLNLKGILWDEENPTAVINETILEVGGDVEGFRVTRIEHDKVYLEKGPQVILLDLNTTNSVQIEK